jgi:hypothetical protein
MSDPKFEFEEGYDIAQVCLNGQVVNFSAGSLSEHNENFCSMISKIKNPTLSHQNASERQRPSVRRVAPFPFPIDGSKQKPNIRTEGRAIHTPCFQNRRSLIMVAGLVGGSLAD